MLVALAVAEEGGVAVVLRPWVVLVLVVVVVGSGAVGVGVGVGWCVGVRGCGWGRDGGVC